MCLGEEQQGWCRIVQCACTRLTPPPSWCTPAAWCVRHPPLCIKGAATTPWELSWRHTQATSVLCVAAGLTVIFVNHHQKGIKHLYSAHSWLGVCIAGFFALQGLQGATVFYGLGGGSVTSSVRRAVLPVHRGVGVVLYYVALLTICLVRVQPSHDQVGHQLHHTVSDTNRYWYHGSQLLLRTDNCLQPKEAQPLSHALTTSN